MIAIDIYLPYTPNVASYLLSYLYYVIKMKV